MAKILTEPGAIRQWTEARGGNPILLDVPDPVAGERSLIQLTFDQHALNADHNEGADPMTPGFRLVDWDEWFAAFEDQGLALVVGDDMSEGRQIDYRIMSRKEAGL